MTVPVVKYKTASPIVKAAERKRKRKETITGAGNQVETGSLKKGDGKTKKETASSNAGLSKKGQKPGSDRKVEVVKGKRVGATKSGKRNATEEIEVDEEQDQTASEAEEGDEDDEDDEDASEQNDDDEDEDEEEDPPVRSSRELAKSLGKSHTYEASFATRLCPKSRPQS